MTKAEIVKKIKDRTGLSRQQAKVAVEIFLSSIKDSLKKGDRVCIVGLGTFYVKDRDMRNGRNPKTGTAVHVTPKKLPFFKCGKELKERVDY